MYILMKTYPNLTAQEIRNFLKSFLEKNPDFSWTDPSYHQKIENFIKTMVIREIYELHDNYPDCLVLKYEQELIEYKKFKQAERDRLKQMLSQSDDFLFMIILLKSTENMVNIYSILTTNKVIFVLFEF